MIIKVCGIRDVENIENILKLNIDMVGLNFYPPSNRYISDMIDERSFDIIPTEVKRVGVFVNSSLEDLQQKTERFSLDLIQLHGDEDPGYCKIAQQLLPIIKVFRIDEDFDFCFTEEYAFANLFLFDTKAPSFGGSGNKFNWAHLTGYQGETQFILSGGIGPNDVELINRFEHPRFCGVDLNSKFETAPAFKDIQLLKNFVEAVKVEHHVVQSKTK